jgi:hypothetical protein
VGDNLSDSERDDADRYGDMSWIAWRARRAKMTTWLRRPGAMLATLFATSLPLLVASTGCRHERRAPTERALHTSVPMVAPDASSDPVSAESPEDKSLGVGGEVWRFVGAWSDAIDRHDRSGLEPFYAEEVGFYGQRRAKAAVVRAKQAILDEDPTFHQQIPGFIDVSREEDYFVVRFALRSGASNAARDTDVRLVLRRGDAGPLLIVEEADQAAATKQQEICETIAAEVVNGLPQVKRRIADAWARVDASGDKLRFGGIGPQNVDIPDGFVASIGIHSDEAFETVVSYRVDRDGRLTVSIASEAPPVVSPSALQRIARACKR